MKSKDSIRLFSFTPSFSSYLLGAEMAPWNHQVWPVIFWTSKGRVKSGENSVQSFQDEGWKKTVAGHRCPQSLCLPWVQIFRTSRVPRRKTMFPIIPCSYGGHVIRFWLMKWKQKWLGRCLGNTCSFSATRPEAAFWKWRHAKCGNSRRRLSPRLHVVPSRSWLLATAPYVRQK